MPDMTSLTTDHDARIQDQFTRQARPFADLKAHSQESVLALIVETAAIGGADRVLDVACGPGLLTCAVARVAREVTGIDIVPAMIERARLQQAHVDLANLTWQVGDARALPFPDASFDRVLTRFSFHHLEEPARVLREMARVCRPGGTVTVVDVAPAAENLAAYDQMERLRDPSHAHALTLDQMLALFEGAGLALRAPVQFRLEMEMERQLAASFPHPGDGDRIRASFARDADSGEDRLGVGAHRGKGGAIYFAYPCTIVCGARAAS